jgi:hypothetical protein
MANGKGVGPEEALKVVTRPPTPYYAREQAMERGDVSTIRDLNRAGYRSSNRGPRRRSGRSSRGR